MSMCIYFRIPHYEQRLKALYYKKKFSERIGEAKPKVMGKLPPLAVTYCSVKMLISDVTGICKDHIMSARISSFIIIWK